jgi:transcriptional regulator with XRE-family HTH domain
MARLNAIFATNLRLLRSARGLSQEELAHLAGRSRNYVSALENERHSPTLDLVQTIAEALEVSPIVLLQRPKGG